MNNGKIRSSLIFDSNVLTLVFSELINTAYTEKGCEFAYQCIRDCYTVCPKWGEIICNQLKNHCKFPTEMLETNMKTTTINQGQYKLKEIWPGFKRIEVKLSVSLEFDFKLIAGQSKICPSFSFTFKPKCYSGANSKTWQFCSWCCILHFDRTKKHHSKQCIPRFKRNVA